MVIVSPLRIGLWDPLFPFQMAFLWLINGGDPNHLLTGMILQVGKMVVPLGWGPLAISPPCWSPLKGDIGPNKYPRDIRCIWG